jgi:hypothetical protein
MLTDIGHFKKERIQAAAFARCSEGLLMHMWGARGTDNPRQSFFFDVLLDQFLPQTGAHEFVVASDFDIGLFASPASDFFYIHDFRNIRAAMTDVHADPLFVFRMIF